MWFEFYFINRSGWFVYGWSDLFLGRRYHYKVQYSLVFTAKMLLVHSCNWNIIGLLCRWNQEEKFWLEVDTARYFCIYIILNQVDCISFMYSRLRRYPKHILTFLHSQQYLGVYHNFTLIWFGFYSNYDGIAQQIKLCDFLVPKSKNWSSEQCTFPQKYFWTYCLRQQQPLLSCQTTVLSFP